MKKIYLRGQKYPGLFALVDDEDFIKLNQYDWYPRKDNKKNFYAQRSEYLGKIDGKYRQTTIQMSREIKRVTDPKIPIDHKNGNTLDNRKENLRITTKSGNNSHLHGLKSNNTSGFRGVTKNKEYPKGRLWRARIYSKDGKRIVLGQYTTAEEAARAFDKAAREIYGEFCGKLNFEEE